MSEEQTTDFAPLTDFELRTLENGWIERDFTGIRLAVAQIVAARVAAARADERKRWSDAWPDGFIPPDAAERAEERFGWLADYQNPTEGADRG